MFAKKPFLTTIMWKSLSVDSLYLVCMCSHWLTTSAEQELSTNYGETWSFDLTLMRNLILATSCEWHMLKMCFFCDHVIQYGYRDSKCHLKTSIEASTWNIILYSTGSYLSANLSMNKKKDYCHLQKLFDPDLFTIRYQLIALNMNFSSFT